MEKGKIILIILVLAIVAFLYFKPQQQVFSSTTTILPTFSEETKKQSLQKLNLTYSFLNGSEFSIAQFLDFSQFTIGNKNSGINALFSNPPESG